jgi:Short C-terminal domain
MFVRRRPLLRSAVVGGAAYMAGKRRAERSAIQAEQEAGQDARFSEPGSWGGRDAAPAAQAGTPAQSMSDQLAQLSMLHDKGALSDAEFASAKARLLGR